MNHHDTTMFIHLASSSVFIGAITSTLLLKVDAERKARQNVHSLIDNLIHLEKLVTGPAAVVITLSGAILIYQASPHLLWSSWLQAILVLWVGSAIIARIFLVPGLQELKSAAPSGPAYIEKARRWNRISMGLLMIQFAILALAVFKPTM